MNESLQPPPIDRPLVIGGVGSFGDYSGVGRIAGTSTSSHILGFIRDKLILEHLERNKNLNVHPVDVELAETIARLGDGMNVLKIFSEGSRAVRDIIPGTAAGMIEILKEHIDNDMSLSVNTVGGSLYGPIFEAFGIKHNIVLGDLYNLNGITPLDNGKPTIRNPFIETLKTHKNPLIVAGAYLADKNPALQTLGYNYLAGRLLYNRMKKHLEKEYGIVGLPSHAKFWNESIGGAIFMLPKTFSEGVELNRIYHTKKGLPATHINLPRVLQEIPEKELDWINQEPETPVIVMGGGSFTGDLSKWSEYAQFIADGIQANYDQKVRILIAGGLGLIDTLPPNTEFPYAPHQNVLVSTNFVPYDTLTEYFYNNGRLLGFLISGGAGTASFIESYIDFTEAIVFPRVADQQDFVNNYRDEDGKQILRSVNNIDVPSSQEERSRILDMFVQMLRNLKEKREASERNKLKLPTFEDPAGRAAAIELMRSVGPVSVNPTRLVDTTQKIKTHAQKPIPLEQ